MSNYAVTDRLSIANETGGVIDQWAAGSLPKVVCPFCGFDYVHFGQSIVDGGEDNYLADWPGRGDLLVIPMSGECGSGWELNLGFHKGQTYIFEKLLVSCEDDSERTP